MVLAMRDRSFKDAEKFLKGPVPWDWIELAASDSSTTALVGIALWRLSGAVKSKTVRLGNSEVEDLNISARSKTRALAALERLGLIKIQQNLGCLPIVTILDCPDDTPHWWDLGA